MISSVVFTVLLTMQLAPPLVPVLPGQRPPIADGLGYGGVLAGGGQSTSEMDGVSV